MPDPAASSAHKAVFLSYAREDAPAAQRIADALSGFGIEAWFDQSELRGGDAWDQKIRRQIKDCALFLPIISANTQARGEGYFRLEWKLAVDRSHLIAEGRPFLIPVAIDAVSEDDALVPAEFRNVQWTRLKGGAPTPTFVDRVHRLMETPAVGRGAEAAPVGEAQAQPRKRGGSSLNSKVLIGAMAVLAAAAAAFVVLRRPTAMPAPPPAPVAAAVAPAAAGPTLASDKSVAVLPFVNMSEEKGTAYFADGIHEDVLTNLALIHDLRVVSRTSVEQYRATTKPIRQIGQELAVTYVLEGSVQRAGSRVRVTGQLIRAATDEHVWAKAYDGDLTDVFAIQSQIAQAIAGALATAISPREQGLLDRRPTQNPEAYDRFIKGRELSNLSPTDAATRGRIELFSQAVQLDPNFAQAWGELADACAYGHFTNLEGGEGYLGRAQAAIERAQALAPDDPDVLRDAGTYYYYGYRDYARAAGIYRRLVALQPNDATHRNSLALIQRRQGQWAESLANSRLAIELDASNGRFLNNHFATLLGLKRIDEALAVERRFSALHPDQLLVQMELAQLESDLTGNGERGDRLIAGLSAKERSSSLGIELCRRWAANRGQWAEAIRLGRLQPFFDGEGTPHYRQALFRAMVYGQVGDRAGVVTQIADFPDQLRQLLRRDPDNSEYLVYLGTFEVLLGQNDVGMRHVRQACELMPPSLDALDGTTYAMIMAIVKGWSGDKDGAIADFRALDRMPNVFATFTLTPYNLDCAAVYPPALTADPRFRALINSPEHLKPLL